MQSLFQLFVPLERTEEVEIDLNTRADLDDLRAILFLMPFWGYGTPLLTFILVMQLSFWSLIPLVFFLLFLIFYLRLLHNKIYFGEDGLKLPGVPSKLLPYQDITAVCFDDKNPHILRITTQTDGRALTYPINVKGMSIEGARLLWENITRRCKNARLNFSMRERLTGWNAEIVAKDKYLTSKDKRDLALTISLRNCNSKRSYLDYFSKFGEAFSKSWSILWVSMSILTIGIYFAMTLFREQLSNTSPFDGSIIIILHLLSVVMFPLSILQPYIGAAVWPLAALGTTGLLTLTVYVAMHLSRRYNQIDRILVNHMGVTTLSKLPSGYKMIDSLPWADIADIQLIAQEGGRTSIAVIPESAIKAQVKIPLRALASGTDREKMLEAMSFFALTTLTDNIKEALSPRATGNFTELWLSGLTTAPALPGLTPLAPQAVLATRPWQVIAMLAAGGQGVTYLVQNTTDDPSSIKVLKEIILPSSANHSAVQRALVSFQKECDLLALIEHPNIARIEDHFVEEGRAYMLLEYVDGLTIDKRVKEKGPFDQIETIALARQMCDILTHLHSQTPPVVHRDFTPQNLILTEQGQLKLIDFGVALQSSETSRLEKATMVGKQNYMPMEQVRGNATHKSDLYAMGCLLYFMLTALHPEPLTVAVADDMDSSIDHDLSALIKKLTAQSEEDRYDSAEACKSALIKLENKF